MQDDLKKEFLEQVSYAENRIESDIDRLEYILRTAMKDGVLDEEADKVINEIETPPR